MTDASFTAVDGMRYTPFGISRDAGTNLSTDHRFTSQVQDAAVGLYWYGSRAYDSATSRFCAPDTIVPSAKNPQALNRYSYVINGPLRLVDPTGHDPSDWFNQSWQKEFQAAHNGASPTAADYVYRLVTMIIASGGGSSGSSGGGGSASGSGGVLQPLLQAEAWINDPQYADAPAHLSPVYLEHHAAALLQGYAVGKVVTAGAASALGSWFFNQRAEIDLVNRYGSTLLVSYRGLPRQGGAAAT